MLIRKLLIYQFLFLVILPFLNGEDDLAPWILFIEIMPSVFPVLLVLPFLSTGIDYIGKKSLTSSSERLLFSLGFHLLFGAVLALFIVYSVFIEFSLVFPFLMGIILLAWLIDYFIPQSSLSRIAKITYLHQLCITIFGEYAYALIYSLVLGNFERFLKYSYPYLVLIFLILPPLTWVIEMVVQQLRPLLQFFVTLALYFALYFALKDPLRFFLGWKAIGFILLIWLISRLLPKKIWMKWIKDPSQSSLLY